MSLVIIKGVSRFSALALLPLWFLGGCGDKMKSKEAVQQAIIERLQSKSGLDLKDLDVITTAVSFDRNMAFATVAFHPKGDAAVNSGMTMKYTLEERGDKWLVVNVGNSNGHSIPGPGISGNEQLPPGHPAPNSADSHLADPHAR